MILRLQGKGDEQRGLDGLDRESRDVLRHKGANKSPFCASRYRAEQEVGSPRQ